MNTTTQRTYLTGCGVVGKLGKNCGQFEANLKSMSKYGVNVTGDKVNYDCADSELANAEMLLEELISFW